MDVGGESEHDSDVSNCPIIICIMTTDMVTQFVCKTNEVMIWDISDSDMANFKYRRGLA